MLFFNSLMLLVTSTSLTLALPVEVSWNATNIPHRFDRSDLPLFSPMSLAPYRPAHLSLHTRNGIIGDDNRQLLNTNIHPYSALGRLSWLQTGKDNTESQGICTGTLIGPRHVLTASHCIHPDAKNMTFTPMYNATSDTRTSIEAYSIQVVIRTDLETAEGCAKHDDLAVLVLNDRVGEQLGWLGFALYDPLKSFRKPIFNAVGYPGDILSSQSPVFQTNISVIEHDAKCGPQSPLYTDIDGAGGMSGGPLWGDESMQGKYAYVYGVMANIVSVNGKAKFTACSAGQSMLDLAMKARTMFP